MSLPPYMATKKEKPPQVGDFWWAEQDYPQAQRAKLPCDLFDEFFKSVTGSDKKVSATTTERLVHLCPEV